jgi:tRNA threonylcarbamoyladenosine biosynthesis protein TsaB
VSVILAWDTTSDAASLALQVDGLLVEECALAPDNGFAHILFSALEALLSRHALTFSNVTLFAAASGPGAFTGVRVGLTAAKGLAEASGKPAAAVSNLAALARFGTADLRAPMLDARRGEIYGAVYHRDGRLIQEETVLKYEDWLATLPPTAEIIREGPLLAAAIAALAVPTDPVAIDANYVRRSDAEMKWKELPK